MIELTEPQIWTVIGVFSAAMFGMMTLVSTMFVSVVRSEIGRIEGTITSEIRRVDAKIDMLDRDVQAIARRVFPEGA